jgi:RNA polymerase sigma-70 factor (ECF subfamily)
MTATLPTRPACPDFADHPEADLLARLAAGDEAAFAELVRDHGGRMLAVARRYLRADADAADAVQDAFLSAFRALPRFRGTARLGTWLHRILVNACLMKLRAKGRRRDVSLDDLLPRFDDAGRHEHPVTPWRGPAADRLADAETRAQVRACIDRLPEPHRTVLLLRDIDGYDTDTVAGLLGLSAGAVKTRLHRARQALRTLLEPILVEAD